MKTLKDHINDENKIMADFYETEYNYYLTKLSNHTNKKPLIIFKNNYEKWKKEEEELKRQVDISYNNLLETYNSIEKSF